MLFASYRCAKMTNRAFPATLQFRTAVGIYALLSLLVLEVGIGLTLSPGSNIWEIMVSNKDPVSGPAYYLSLLLFAVLPRVLTKDERKSA